MWRCLSHFYLSCIPVLRQKTLKIKKNKIIMIKYCSVFLHICSGSFSTWGRCCHHNCNIWFCDFERTFSRCAFLITSQAVWKQVNSSLWILLSHLNIALAYVSKVLWHFPFPFFMNSWHYPSVASWWVAECYKQVFVLLQSAVCLPGFCPEAFFWKSWEKYKLILAIMY